MIGHNVRNYVVAVNTENDDPLVFGPYTQRKARELEKQFNDRIDKDQHGWINASAYPIQNPQTVKQMLREFGQ